MTGGAGQTDRSDGRGIYLTPRCFDGAVTQQSRPVNNNTRPIPTLSSAAGLGWLDAPRGRACPDRGAPFVSTRRCVGTGHGRSAHSFTSPRRNTCDASRVMTRKTFSRGANPCAFFSFFSFPPFLLFTRDAPPAPPHRPAPPRSRHAAFRGSNPTRGSPPRVVAFPPKRRSMRGSTPPHPTTRTRVAHTNKMARVTRTSTAEH